MPLTPAPLEPGTLPEPTPPEPAQAAAHPAQAVPDPDAPLTFVPHPALGEPPQPPIRFRTNRYGALEEHELVRLLDTFEDERARGRFRESMYLSTLICIAVALVVLYGPRYIWHAPQLINPADAIRQHELTQLNLPLTPKAPGPPAPKPAPVSRQTIKQLQAMTKAEPRREPAPTPAPAPTPTTPPPSAVAANNPPPPPLPSAPAPRTPVSTVPDAPAPQPTTTRPNFSQPNSSPGTTLGRAIAGATPGSRGDTGPSVPTRGGGNVGGGVQVLSDMQGVDFSEYLRRLQSDVYRNWIPLLPEETQAPLLKQGVTYIRFTILPDGRIGEMHLETSTHDTAIDKAAWGSIISEGQFPPLPTKFHGPNLELRFVYYVNKGIGQ